MAECDHRLHEGRCLYCTSLEHCYIDCPKTTWSTVDHPGGSSSLTPPTNSGTGRAGQSSHSPGVPAASNNTNNGNQSYGRATFTISAPSDENSTAISAPSDKTPTAPPALSLGNVPATQNYHYPLHIYLYSFFVFSVYSVFSFFGFVLLLSVSIPSLSSSPFSTLMGCGASNDFIDFLLTPIASVHTLPVPIALYHFDGSSMLPASLHTG